MRRCHSTNFTFHNVSINTNTTENDMTDYQCFTFHNVSINTAACRQISTACISLHSTMFLLILETLQFAIHCSIFTFHNVSINTPYSLLPYNTIIILSLSVDFVILLIFLLHKNRKRSSCKAFY